MKSILTIVFFSISCFCSRAQVFSTTVLNQALGANLVRWKADSSVNNEYSAYDVVSTSKAMYYLSLYSYFNPTNTSATNRLLAHIRNVIAGGNEPTCRGTIAGWADNALAQSLTLAKKTPQVWGQLTEAEVNKCDWLMKALIIAGNYNQNYNHTALADLLGTFLSANKRNNPNIQEGYVGVMITGYNYFGGAEAVNNILANFNYDFYIDTLAKLSLSNIVYGWTYRGAMFMKGIMENGGSPFGGGTIAQGGVRLPFSFLNYQTPPQQTQYDPVAVYKDLANKMFLHIATDTSASGQAYTLGNTTSPVTGLLGMCYEFQSTDAGGDGIFERSSPRYAYDGWMNNIITKATLKALGLWITSSANEDFDRTMEVGSIDLLYKYKVGYYGRSNGTRATFTEPIGINLGYTFVKDIWNGYLWTYPDQTILNVLQPTLKESFSGLSLTTTFTSGSFTGVRGIVWSYLNAARNSNGLHGVKPADSMFISLAPAGAGVLKTVLDKPLNGIRFKARNISGSGTASIEVKLNGNVLKSYAGFITDKAAVISLVDVTATIGDVLEIVSTGTAQVAVDDIEMNILFPPNPPSNLTVINSQMSEISLSWTDNSATESGFRIEKREWPNGSFEVIQNSLSANTNKFTVTALNGETEYEFRLTAFNSGGYSDGVLVKATTLPAIVLDSFVIDPSADAYVNAGTGAANNYGRSNVMLLKSAGATSNFTREIFFRFDLPVISKPLHRAVLRVNTTLVESNVNPPTIQLNIVTPANWIEGTQTGQTATGGSITWNSSRSFTTLDQIATWDPVLGINKVDLATAPLQNYLGGAVSFKAVLLENLNTYVNSREISTIANRPQLTLYFERFFAPDSLIVSGTIHPYLEWADNSSNEAGFIIQRKLSNDAFVAIDTVSENISSYTDSSVAPCNNYEYRVFAYDSTGKSAYSNQVAVLTQQPVTGLLLDSASIEVNVDSSYRVIANVLPVTACNKTIIWSSSDTSVAKVDSTGLIRGISCGTVTISASTAEGNFTVSVPLTVSRPVNGIQIDASKVYLTQLGATLTLNETLVPLDACNNSVSWISTNPEVATVDTNGLIIAKSYGTTTISVTTQDGGYVSSCIVNVIAPSSLPNPVRPVLECVSQLSNGNYLAHFGYKNDNDAVVVIPVGDKNKFSNSANAGQPTFFLLGRQYNVFSVEFTGANLVWTLNGRTSTAGSNSVRCATYSTRVLDDFTESDNLNFTVSPNPGTGREIKVSGQVDGAVFEVLNMQGVRMNARIHSIDEFSVIIKPLTLLPAGIYFLKISKGHTVRTKKFIVIQH